MGEGFFRDSGHGVAIQGKEGQGVDALEGVAGEGAEKVETKIQNPKFFERYNGFFRIVGEEIVEQTDTAQSIIDSTEDVRVQPLNHIPLQVESCQR